MPTSRHERPEAEGAKMLIEAVLSERRKISPRWNRRRSCVPAGGGADHGRAHADRGLLLAEQIGFPIAMKVDSPDLPHKSDAGGVRLNIPNAPAVRNAYHDIIETVYKKHPNARINGASIEPYLARPKRPRTDARRRCATRSSGRSSPSAPVVPRSRSSAIAPWRCRR